MPIHPDWPEAHWGTYAAQPIDWRKQPTPQDPDDELVVTPDVIEALGFDPSELDDDDLAEDFDPNQPRDEEGKWTSTGAAGPFQDALDEIGAEPAGEGSETEYGDTWNYTKWSLPTGETIKIYNQKPEVEDYIGWEIYAPGKDPDKDKPVKAESSGPQKLLRALSDLVSFAGLKQTPEGEAIAYHATKEQFTAQIKEQGLKVRAPTRNFGEGLYKGSRGESVYVATTLQGAKDWADVIARSGFRYTPRADKMPPMSILEVHIPPGTKMEADEHAGSGALRYVGDIPPEWIKNVRHVKWKVDQYLSTVPDVSEPEAWDEELSSKVIYLTVILASDDDDTSLDAAINGFFASDAEWDESKVKRDEEGKFATQAGKGDISDQKRDDYFNAIENVTTTEGIEAAEDNWRGGVADFGDPEAAILVQAMEGYFDYRSELEDAAREHLGDEFSVYRVMRQSQIDSWKAGDDMPPMATSTSEDFARSFTKFAGFQMRPDEDYVIVRIPATPNSLIMRGSAEESELVIDANEISADTIEVLGPAIQHSERQKTEEEAREEDETRYSYYEDGPKAFKKAVMDTVSQLGWSPNRVRMLSTLSRVPGGGRNVVGLAQPGGDILLGYKDQPLIVMKGVAAHEVQHMRYISAKGEPGFREMVVEMREQLVTDPGRNITGYSKQHWDRVVETTTPEGRKVWRNIDLAIDETLAEMAQREMEWGRERMRESASPNFLKIYDRVNELWDKR